MSSKKIILFDFSLSDIAGMLIMNLVSGEDEEKYKVLLEGKEL